LPEALQRALRARGVTQLYAHQAEAWEAAQAGRHVLIATPTASGKTLCYTLPVLAAAMHPSTSARRTTAHGERSAAESNHAQDERKGSKALYLFPDQGAGAGSGGRTAGTQPGRRISG
jgi:ATP-dependent helicase YprA (DUF1998 family)